MDKLIKVGFTLLLVASIAAPGSFATAKTIEDVPTTESSILSRTADPISISQQRLEQEKSEDSDSETNETTKETDTTENSKDKESSTEKTKDSTSESSTETTDSSKEEIKKKSPRATVLRVGTYGVDDPDDYDIEASLDAYLRSSGHIFGGNNQSLNIEFTGKNKAPNTLTLEDMKSITLLRIGPEMGPFIRSGIGNAERLKGLELATNLEVLYFRGFTLLEGVSLEALPKLKKLEFREMSKLGDTLNLNSCPELTDLTIYRVPNGNTSGQLDFSQNKKIKNVDIIQYYISAFSIENNSSIEYLRLQNCKIKSLYFESCDNLETLYLARNEFNEIDLRGVPNLVNLTVAENYRLEKIDLSSNTKLEYSTIYSNNIGDITSAYGLPMLRWFDAKNQTLVVPVKVINGKAEIDKLRTTNKKGLSVTKGTLIGSPGISLDGEKIKLTNITAANINGKYLNFTYNSSDLAEKGPGGSAFFDGKITLYAVADLKTELKADKKKIDNGDTVSWTWTVSSFADSSAVDIFPKINLPTGLSLVPGSVKVDNSPVADNAIDSSVSLGTLGENETKTITFETTATGNPEDWLEAKGEINWDDSTGFGPYNMESSDKVQIKDEEQTDTPQPTEEMGLLSVPIRFDYGIKDMSNTSQTFGLSPDLYQTNTNVVNNGFYTRVKDDRTTSTGWSLTAQLSSFVNVTDTSSGMPDSYGTALRFEDLSIEGVKDRDTPQESIDPGAAGAPTLVNTSEKIVAGDSAKTLVSAEPYEGQGTWQLRIPFDKVFLDLPAYAGKERTNFQAKLTWSLNDTPTP